jgi:aminoglycoside/choline kinase family phosphotransferase
LPRIQARQKIPNWSLPQFCDDILMAELKNFYEWSVIKFAALTLNTSEEKLLKNTFDFLQKNAETQPQVGAHRDYHSRNLMILADQSIGVIDFQDAVIGPVTYDLVSLLRDCYVNWPLERVQEWVKDYYEKFGDKKAYSLEQFQRWFDLQGVQRHLKALFIFCRKYLRDHSTYYLGDIPRTLNYVREITKQYSELHEFHEFIENRFAKPLLAKIDRIQKRPS